MFLEGLILLFDEGRGGGIGSEERIWGGRMGMRDDG